MRHINSLFELPHHKDLRDRLLHAWWKYTGEGSPRKRRRAPKDHSIHFYRILTEQEARDAYVQTFRNKPRKYFVQHINRAYPLPHHKQLRDRLFETWPATDIRGDKAVPPVLAESARNADQQYGASLNFRMTIQCGEKNARQPMVFYLRPCVGAVYKRQQGRVGMYPCWQMYKLWLHLPTLVSWHNIKIPNISRASEKKHAENNTTQT